MPPRPLQSRVAINERLEDNWCKAHAGRCTQSSQCRCSSSDDDTEDNLPNRILFHKQF